MTYEDLILDRMRPGAVYTTQALTEILFDCRKGDARYNNYVEDVTKDLQKLKRKGLVKGERVNTGKGYCINIWSVVE